MAGTHRAWRRESLSGMPAETVRSPACTRHAADLYRGRLARSDSSRAGRRPADSGPPVGAAPPHLPPLELAAKEPAAEGQAAAVWRSTLIESLPAACVAVANARAALATFRPKVMVVGNDITVEGRAAGLAAKAAGVSVVVMMHGHVGVNNPLHGLHLADRLVAYGDAHRRVLTQLGISADAISVCGAPYLDQRPAAGATVHPAIAKAFSLSPGDPWVLVATSGPGHSVSLAHHLTLIENLLVLSARFPEVTFIAKLHRKDNPQYYHDLMAKHPAKRRLMIVRAGSPGVPDNILDWLQGCRAVLTGASMVAIEAMLMHVPVITMDFAGELSGVEFIDAGATRHVRTLAELEDRLRTILAVRRGERALGGHDGLFGRRLLCARRPLGPARGRPFAFASPTLGLAVSAIVPSHVGSIAGQASGSERMAIMPQGKSRVQPSLASVVTARAITLGRSGRYGVFGGHNLPPRRRTACEAARGRGSQFVK